MSRTKKSIAIKFTKYGDNDPYWAKKAMDEYRVNLNFIPDSYVYPNQPSLANKFRWLYHASKLDLSGDLDGYEFAINNIANDRALINKPELWIFRALIDFNEHLNPNLNAMDALHAYFNLSEK